MNLGELHKESTEAGVTASRATTHRRVKEFGYSCRQRRLTWAKENKNWTVPQWSKVLFSDERKFCISFVNQGPRVWRKGGYKYKLQIKLRWALFVTYTIIQSIMRSEMCSLHLTHPSAHTWSSGQLTVQRLGKLIAKEAHSQSCLKSSVKFPQSVMIWGAMSSAGVGPLCFLKTNVTAPVYQDILEHFMLPSADQLFKDADFIFQQDFAPAHTAKSTKSWLNDHYVGVLDWQANSQTWTP